MFQNIKRYFAIRRYVQGLGGELARRFGRHPYYKAVQVTQAVQRGGYSPLFIAYAHAAFCSEQEFEALYKISGGEDGYLGLRRIIARRYFSGYLDFDACTILNRQDRGKYSSADGFDSSLGSVDGGSSGHSGLY